MPFPSRCPLTSSHASEFYHYTLCLPGLELHSLNITVTSIHVECSSFFLLLSTVSLHEYITVSFFPLLLLGIWFASTLEAIMNSLYVYFGGHHGL